MDKNIAALMRTDVVTVGVRFFKEGNKEYQNDPINLDLGRRLESNLSPKEYTYVTNLTLEVGDLCCVFVTDIPKVVVVTSVHKGVAIEPNESTLYKWVVSKIDLTAFKENRDKNDKIMDILHVAYKKNLKKQFSQILFEGLGEEGKNEMLKLIGETKDV